MANSFIEALWGSRRDNQKAFHNELFDLMSQLNGSSKDSGRATPHRVMLGQYFTVEGEPS